MSSRRTTLLLTCLTAAIASLAASAGAAKAADCPEGGVVRFGVEPFDTSARLIPIYEQIGKALSEKVGCEVKVFVATSYNAEIEAMRNGKLEAGQFGPLGYVLAHQVAKAEVVAAYSDANGKPDTYWASIVTYPGSGIKSVADIKGHSFAFSDPASTSGHLFPAYGLRKAGLDPDKDVRGTYAGSHTASFEALYNHKVDAGELNSEQIESAKQRGHYKDGDVVFLWKSDAIPEDAITVRGDLSPALKQRLTAALQNLDLSHLSDADRKVMGLGGMKLVPQTDSAYDGIRDMVKILNIDLEKLSVQQFAADARLSVRGLGMAYPNGTQALHSVDLDVRAGELLVVLGGNGCGKTTLLRCIAGALKPGQGQVLLDGRDLSGCVGEARRQARLDIAMIWQHAALVRRRSVLANVICGALGRNRTWWTSLGGLPAGEIPGAMECLAEVGLTHLASQRAGTLSGGQAQRVAIARGLMQRPKVVLADEPVASLDPEAAQDIMQLLRRLAHEDGLAVLCVLHQVELAFSFADRVVGMRAGHVVFDRPRGHLSSDEVQSLYARAA